jgi:hypothetical protein
MKPDKSPVVVLPEAERVEWRKLVGEQTAKSKEDNYNGKAQEGRCFRWHRGDPGR